MASRSPSLARTASPALSYATSFADFQSSQGSDDDVADAGQPVTPVAFQASLPASLPPSIADINPRLVNPSEASEFTAGWRRRYEIAPLSAANVIGGRHPTGADRLRCPPCAMEVDFFDICSPDCAFCLMRSCAVVEFVEDDECSICGSQVEAHHASVVKYDTVIMFQPPVVLRASNHASCENLPAHHQMMLAEHKPDGVG